VPSTSRRGGQQDRVSPKPAVSFFSTQTRFTKKIHQNKAQADAMAVHKQEMDERCSRKKSFMIPVKLNKRATEYVTSSKSHITAMELRKVLEKEQFL
jgi:hypothetical protein